MPNSLELLFWGMGMCGWAWAAGEVFKYGMNKGIALALDNIQSMNSTIDLMVIDERAVLEIQFYHKKKEKAHGEKV